jgi:hypothetical protein
MIKETYRMEVEIEFEFNDENISAVDATDLIDYFADVEVKLNNENVNILAAKLSVIND